MEYDVAEQRVAEDRGRTRTVSSPVRISALLLGVIACGVLLTGWTAPLGYVLASVWIGLVVVLNARTAQEALWVAGVAGASTAVLSLIVYSPPSIDGALRGMPTIANVDIAGDFYELFVVNAMQGNVGTQAYDNPGKGMLALALGVALPASVVLGTRALARRPGISSASLRAALGYAAALLLAVSLAVTVWNASALFRDYVSTEPVAETYAFDPYIMLKTYYLMEGGQDYYEAYKQAVISDARLSPGTDLVDGKFVGPYGSLGAFNRQPWLFYAWVLLAPSNGAYIHAIAIALCAGVPVGLYIALRPDLGDGGLLAAASAVPGLIALSSWANVFHADFWAMLAVVYSMMLVFRRKWVGAILLALLAALCREVMLAWLAMVIAAALWDTRGDPRFVRRAAAGVLALASFGAMYAWHAATMATHVVPTEGSSAPERIIAYIMSKSLAERVLPATYYAMFPYTQLRFSSVVFPVLGAVALLVAPLGRVPKATAAAYLTFWLAFYALVGPSSSYWGQAIMTLSVVAIFIGVASLAHGTLASWRAPQGG